MKDIFQDDHSSLRALHEPLKLVTLPLLTIQSSSRGCCLAQLYRQHPKPVGLESRQSHSWVAYKTVVAWEMNWKVSSWAMRSSEQLKSRRRKQLLHPRCLSFSTSLYDFLRKYPGGGIWNRPWNMGWIQPLLSLCSPFYYMSHSTWLLCTQVPWSPAQHYWMDTETSPSIFTSRNTSCIQPYGCVQLRPVYYKNPMLRQLNPSPVSSLLETRPPLVQCKEQVLVSLQYALHCISTSIPSKVS